MFRIATNGMARDGRSMSAKSSGGMTVSQWFHSLEPLAGETYDHLNKCHNNLRAAVRAEIERLGLLIDSGQLSYEYHGEVCDIKARMEEALR